MKKEEAYKMLMSGKSVEEIFPLVHGQDSAMIYKADRFLTGDEIIYVREATDIPYDQHDLREEECGELLDNMFTGDDFMTEGKGIKAYAEGMFWYVDWQGPDLVDYLEGDTDMLERLEDDTGLIDRLKKASIGIW